MTKGYWQIPLSPESKEKTAFSAPDGLYQFRTLPFGLFGAPATFQRLMDRVLRPHAAFAAAYLDDVIIHSTSWAQHMRHVGAVLESLRQAGLTANPKKCAIGRAEVRYLWYHLGSGQVRPLVDKTAAITTCPKRSVWRFDGRSGPSAITCWVTHSPIHPRPPTVAPPHGGYQRPNHSLVSGLAAL